MTVTTLARLSVGLCMASALTTNLSAQKVSKPEIYSEMTLTSRGHLSKLKANGMLARNTDATIGTVSTPATTKTNSVLEKSVKKHDPKAVGRCWNRLMEMIREAKQAHQRQED